MAEEFNNEELEFTPEVVQEEVAPIIVEEPVEAPIAEESAVVEEAPAPKKRSSRKKAPKVVAEVKPEVSEASPKKTKEGKTPGMYHRGRKISAVPARLGNKWTVIINGKREKILKKEIEIVK